MSVCDADFFRPWPLQRFHERLCADDTLWRLCQPRTAGRKFDTREFALEDLVQDVLREHVGAERIAVRKPIGRTLGLHGAPFPARALPDIVVSLDGKFHVCELKSSRIDYGRFDCVFESQPFRNYLAEQGHVGADPWEVEQDLIKLRRVSRLTNTVGSCLFLMVDAYAGRGRSWSKVFSDIEVFTATMRTDLVRQWGKELLASTSIESIRAAGVEARLIVCRVFSDETPRAE